MQRAAPGMSTLRLSEMGLPMSSVSSSASSSVCLVMRSAKRNSSRLRFAGARFDQLPLRNTARAEATARLMSSASPAATLVPVDRFGFGVHIRSGPSESRWGTGTDDLTRLASDVAETVRQLTGEIIGLTGPEHARRAPDGELHA